MARIADRDHLLAHQYRDAANLNARIELHRRFSVNRYGWQRWLFDHLDLPFAAHILELGCGPGDLWRENLHRLPRHWHIVLSDLSPGMVAQARAALTAAGLAPLPHFAVADAQTIPHPPSTFDAVVANHMLYHVPDRPKALAEIRRVLKPGGKLYAATVGAGHLAELHDLAAAAGLQPNPQETSDRLFGLQNGAQQLAPWFAEIQRHDYDDALVVTEAEPLIAYVRASEPWYALAADEEAIERFADLVRQRLAAAGAIPIAKSSGLFVARRT